MRVNGHAADFSRRDNKLIIKPSTAVDGRFKVAIKYHGKPVTHIDPDGSDDGWKPTTDGGATVLSEPVGAMTWFPNNNTPRDKATFDMKITVPPSLKWPAAVTCGACGSMTARRPGAGNSPTSRRHI